MSTTGLRIQVLGAYARLLRSQRKAFQKDYKTREKALEQSRTEFRKNASVDDPAKIEDLVKQSDAVSDFLQKNLIQAEQTGERAFTKLNVKKVKEIERVGDTILTALKERRARRERDKDKDRDRDREESSRETIVNEDQSTTVKIPMPSVRIPSDVMSRHVYEPIVAPTEKKRAPVSPTPSTEGAQ